MGSEQKIRMNYLKTKIELYKKRIRDKNNSLYQEVMRTNEDLSKIIKEWEDENSSLRAIIQLFEEQKEEITVQVAEERSLTNEVTNQLLEENTFQSSQIEAYESQARQFQELLDAQNTKLIGIERQLSTTIYNFFDSYDRIRDLLRQNFRVNNDGTSLDQRFNFTKEFIGLSQMIGVNPLQALFGNV